MKRVELFHIGPQKSGTTWLWRCLTEHPEVGCSPKDSIHYFDMHYHRGRDWYVGHFADAAADSKWLDPTPSTIRSPWAARRIHEENPDGRIILCLRNPLERAFSHYWHEKKKLRFEFEFHEVLTNYDLYSSWLEPGFYAEHLERFLGYFPQDQLLCQRFDRLGEDPEAFWVEFCRFAGIRDDLRPSMLHRKVNVAGARHTKGGQLAPRLRAGLRKLPGGSRLTADEAWLTGKDEYLRGVPDEWIEPIWAICEPEVARLEALTGLDLTAWRPGVVEKTI